MYICKTLIDILQHDRYILRDMIEGFGHKGLKRLYENDDGSKLPPEMLPRIRLILSTLDAATTIEGMDQPTFRLHPLKGDLKGYWAVVVRANWRIVFRFVEGKVLNVDFVDYH